MKNIKRILAVVLALMMMAACAVAESDNPAFNKVFTDRGIFHLDNIFFMMDSSAYVMDGGTYVDCLEFGHSMGLVLSYVETVYMDVTGYDEATRASIDAQMKATYSHCESIEDVEITYAFTGNYYVLTIRVENLDDPSVVRTIVDAGLMTLEGDASAISIVHTDTALQAAGFIKR